VTAPSSCRRPAASRAFFLTPPSRRRGIGVFAAINAFDINAGLAMAKTANDLIAELAPR
jgi:hypothetical protein